MSVLKKAIKAAAVNEPLPGNEGWIGQTFTFEPGFLGFSGHFPGYPLVPAFVQVLASIAVMERVKETGLELSALDNAKFQRELRPGASVNVECRETAGLPLLAFQARITDEEGKAATFSVRCMAAEQVEP
ncbi:MAG: 3-hydroxyacyl-ACP dehydratase [Syntrophorhabdales bacterium]|jgi:3-hydroxyacyl-[acyl-carrier-protein] dehydratase